MLAVADPVSADAGLASPFLAVNDHVGGLVVGEDRTGVGVGGKERGVEDLFFFSDGDIASLSAFHAKYVL